MGADIHVYLEYRKDGAWHSGELYQLIDGEYSTVPVYSDRNYTLFGMLAGVRDRLNEYPISEPRGIPKDVTDVTREAFEEWKEWLFAPSWLTLRELYENAPRYDDAIEELFEYMGWGDPWNPVLDLADRVARRIDDMFVYFGANHTKYWDDVRIVFWFDN